MILLCMYTDFIDVRFIIIIMIGLHSIQAILKTHKLHQTRIFVIIYIYIVHARINICKGFPRTRQN